MQAEDGEYRDERVAKSVPEKNRGGRKPLGARGADIVAGKLLDYGNAHHAREDRGERGAESDRRQNQMRRAAASGNGQPSENHGKYENQYGA